MKLTITTRKADVPHSFSSRAEKKLAKLDKFFDTDAVAEITVSQERNMQRVEITIRNEGMIFRAEETSMDAAESLDKLVDVLLRQIRKNKTRLEKRLRHGAFVGEMPWEDVEPAAEDEEDGSEYRIVRSKKFAVKPMDVEEAILQMNMLGHQFYMFRNMDSGEINVVYSRHNGDYGLLEPNV